MALTEHQPDKQPQSQTDMYQIPGAAPSDTEVPAQERRRFSLSTREKVMAGLAAAGLTLGIGAIASGGEDEPRPRANDRPAATAEPSPSSSEPEATQSPEASPSPTEVSAEQPIMPVEPGATQLAEVADSPIETENVAPYVNTELAEQLKAEYPDFADLLSDETKAKVLSGATPERLYESTRSAYEAFTDDVIVNYGPVPAMPTYESKPWSSSQELAEAIVSTRNTVAYKADTLYENNAPVSADQVFSFMYLPEGVRAATLESFNLTKAEGRPYVEFFQNSDVIGYFTKPYELNGVAGEQLFVATVSDVPLTAEPDSPIREKVGTWYAFSTFPEGTFRISDGTNVVELENAPYAKVHVVSQRVVEFIE